MLFDSSSDMFYDRSILGEGLCPMIAKSPMSSFSISKEETASTVSIMISMPGKQKMKLTKQGLRVSLCMSRDYPKRGIPRRMDVKTFFDFDTFFIEAKGKTKKDHYITCIHLPEGFNKKHNMIRREMKGERFYAWLPYANN